MKRPKRVYLVLKIVTEGCVAELPFPINITNKAEKCIGMAPIFSSKKAAAKASNKGEFQVVLMEIPDA